MVEEKKERKLDQPSKKTVYFGTGEVGAAIQWELIKDAERRGYGWTLSRVLLQAYREKKMREGFTTSIPDQTPRRKEK